MDEVRMAPGSLSVFQLPLISHESRIKKYLDGGVQVAASILLTMSPFMYGIPIVEAGY
jgi:hypothetical protein